MNMLPSRSALILGLACSALAVAPAAAGVEETPKVSYLNVQKQCSTYTVDGQEQKQCQADFTVRVADIKRNYKIVLTARDPHHDMTTTVGKFTSDGVSAKKRFDDVVVSYGAPDDQVNIRFRVIVRDAAGTKVFASKAHTF